ncbi:transcriptional regulator with XRE-family HTH domain [Dysgonomonadaceae bacterium PH5-43]|nr:transcriptional regulator with XRE-family HTH domain [Dysgonomonadaceae bacterium PH5-43]
MKRTKTVILPRLTRLLGEMGENIKLARLRRKLTAEQVAERAGISRSTLWQVEKGLPSVSLGTYAQVLFVLGLEQDLQSIAKDDILGRKLQDAKLTVGKRAPKTQQSTKTISHQ